MPWPHDMDKNQAATLMLVSSLVYIIWYIYSWSDMSHESWSWCKIVDLDSRFYYFYVGVYRYVMSMTMTMNMVLHVKYFLYDDSIILCRSIL